MILVFLSKNLNVKMQRFLMLGLPPLLVVFTDILMISKVKGRSMSPALNPNTDKERDVLLVRRGHGYLRKGDVVVVISPFDPSLKLIKRVAGVAGDVVYNENGKPGLKRFLVPHGRVWLLSDDCDPRNIDSRTLGPIPQGLVIGRAICKIWPWNGRLFEKI